MNTPAPQPLTPAPTAPRQSRIIAAAVQAKQAARQLLLGKQESNSAAAAHQSFRFGAESV